MKVKGFGDYDFSKEEIEAAHIKDDEYDGLFLLGLAVWPKFKKQEEQNREVTVKS